MPSSNLTGANQELSTSLTAPTASHPPRPSPADDTFDDRLSDTDTLGPDSPDIAPLSAQPPRLAFPRTPSTNRSSTSSANGHYYTASWGSPYDLSLPPISSLVSPYRRSVSSAGLSGDDLDAVSSPIYPRRERSTRTRTAVSRYEPEEEQFSSAAAVAVFRSLCGWRDSDHRVDSWR